MSSYASTPRGDLARTAAVRITVERLRRDLSQQQLCDRLADAGWPVAQTTLSCLEHGTRRITVDHLELFALVFGVTAADLLVPPTRDELLATFC